MANRTTRTPKKDQRFLQRLARTGLVALSARQAGYSRSRVYVWRGEDPDFAEAWADAIEEHAEHLEAEADRRATLGIKQPVFYRGAVVGHITKYSDSLLIYRLQTLKQQRQLPPGSAPDTSPSETSSTGLDAETLQRIRQEIYNL